jgi:hypothetical protein
MSTRHQCLLHEGPSYLHLEVVAECIKRQLGENYRCLFMDNKPAIAEVCSYLTATGIDVEEECRRTRLLLSSKPKHLGWYRIFNPDRMLRQVEQVLDQALEDHFSGLFVFGDMTWEFGPRKNFSKLLEYEWRSERLFRERLQLTAICRYHVDTLPREALRIGAIVHETILVNEKLSVPNPNYIGMRPAKMNLGERILNF